MPVNVQPPTLVDRSDMTGDQLALSTSEEVSTETLHGKVIGGRVKNGCQVFLNVPYGIDVPRFSDPKPLPDTYRYSGKFIKDGKYCAQPTRPYTLQIPVRDRLGLGEPTENPFFADIYVPSHYVFNSDRPLLPVRVFIHGGFLQFGSTSGQHYNQQFFSSEHYDEVRVLLGHRVSVLGFLGSETPAIAGNYGFKDCWLGLEWVQKHIASFGGDPAQVHLSGLSGGGHVVHQLIHHAARLAPAKAPFLTVLHQSNAILTNPVSPSSRNGQFAALCKALDLDPSDPDILNTLRDTSRVTTEELIAGVLAMGDLSTFRGVVGTDGWVRADEMEYQQNGGLANGLREAGVRCIISGDVKDEAFFYQIVHSCQNTSDILPNLCRYYPKDIAGKLLAAYEPLPEDSSPEECDKLQGRILADGQVHLPVRLLAKDLAAFGFPVIRYAVEMVAEAVGSKGMVSHGTDLVIHHLRLSMMDEPETNAALAFNAALNSAIADAVDGQDWKNKGEEEMLVLKVDGTTSWSHDWRWAELRAAERALRS